MSAQSLKRIEANWIVLAVIAATIILLLAGFGEAFHELQRRWNQQEEYSHGYLVPFVSAWLLWVRRDALLGSFGRPSWIGVLLMVVAATLYAIGEFSAIFILSQVAFVVTLLGIALGVGGYPLLRVVFIPVIFLLFAIPLPYFVDATLSLRLQLISSELGVFFINLFGIPVYLDGNVIDMGNYKLQVVDACSGLRYLYPLMSLSFLAAYLFHAPFWKRCMVFLSAIPITIFMNGFRIGVVGFMVDRFGPQAPDGFLHLFEGWVIFIACAVLLAGEIQVLARMSGKRFFDVFYVPTLTVAQQDAVRHRGPTGYLPMAISLAFLLAIGVGGAAISRRPEFIPDRTPFAEFPSRVGEWTGHVSLMDPETVHYLGLDDYILSDYTGSDSRPVNLYIAYYSSQRQGMSPHSPIVCIPGGGWQINVFDRTVFNGPSMEFPMNRVVISKGNSKQIVYYWFDERGEKIANEWVSKWHLLSDAITKNRTDGALVRLTTPVYPGELERDADERLHAFAAQVVPKLSGYLPPETLPQANPVASVQAKILQF